MYETTLDGAMELLITSLAGTMSELKSVVGPSVSSSEVVAQVSAVESGTTNACENVLYKTYVVG